MKGLRVVLVPLFGSGIDAECLATGLAVAGRFGAHVDALFVRIDPLDAIPVIGEGVSPAIIDQLTQAAAAEMDRQSALLMIPPGGATAFGQIIAIAWNGSTQAARAVAGALRSSTRPAWFICSRRRLGARRRTSGSISPPMSNGAASPASDGR